MFLIHFGTFIPWENDLHFGTFIPWENDLHFGTFIPWENDLHFGTFPEILKLFPWGKSKNAFFQRFLNFKFYILELFPRFWREISFSKIKKYFFEMKFLSKISGKVPKCKI